MFCPSCGEKLEADSIFCGNCGTRIVEDVAPAAEPTQTSGMLTSNVAAVLKRGFLALEDGEWAKADAFFEQVLNHNAEDAEAYLGKLMAQLRVNSRDALKNCKEPLEKNNNYRKAMRFGDEALKNELAQIEAEIQKKAEEIASQPNQVQSVETDNGMTDAELAQDNKKMLCVFGIVAGIFMGFLGFILLQDSQELAVVLCLGGAFLAAICGILLVSMGDGAQAVAEEPTQEDANEEVNEESNEE